MYLASEKCKNDCKIFKITLVLKPEIAPSSIRFRRKYYSKVLKYTIIFFSHFCYQINAVDRCSGFYWLYWFYWVDGYKQIA